MSYGQTRPSSNYDHNSRPPAPTLDVSDIRFGADIPELLFADIALIKDQIVAEAGILARGIIKSSKLSKFYEVLVMWYYNVAF